MNHSEPSIPIVIDLVMFYDGNAKGEMLLSRLSVGSGKTDCWF